MKQSIYYWFLIICIVLSIIRVAMCGRPQYNNYIYDAHPQTYGQDVRNIHARQMCERMDKRICSSNDIDVFARQERHHCRSAQAFNSATRKIYGHISRSNKEPCIKTLLGPIQGVYPRSQHPSGITFLAFFCLKKTKTKKIECSGNGEDYKGYKFLTKSGKLCQNQISQMPNKHIYSPAKNPEKNIQKNYCRNPDQSASPWCYLAKEVGRETCGIECANYGKFEHCEAIFYEKANFTGTNCSIKVDKAAGSVMSDIKGDDKSAGCKNVNLKKKVGSQRVIGKQCSAKIFYKSDDYLHIVGDYNKSEEKLYNKKIFKVFLFDQSADVILGTFGAFYSTEKSSDYHICKVDEVDNAVYPVYTFPNLSTGLAFIDNILVVYSRGEETNFVPGKKFSQCCLNEFPKLGTQKVKKEEAEDWCNTQNRLITGERRGVIIPGRHNRRVCTAADLQAHFTNFGQKFDRGWADQIRKDDVRLVQGTANPPQVHVDYSSPQYALPQCCDKDCLPYLGSCNSNESCCTGMCVNWFCQSDKIKENPKGRRYEPKNSPLKRQIMFIVSLYVLGWILRCCCPKRRPREFHPHID